MKSKTDFRHVWLLIALCFLPFGSAFAQNITVKGIVTDAIGPVIGASVIQKGTTNGAVTEIDGAYSLNVPQNAVLTVSCIGYRTQV